METPKTTMQEIFEQVQEDKAKNRMAWAKYNKRYCPNCKKIYTPDLKPGQGTPTQREQHITGICSDECWNQLLSEK